MNKNHHYTSQQDAPSGTTAHASQMAAVKCNMGMRAALLIATSAMMGPLALFAAGPPPVDLRSASSFTILAGATITTTGGGAIGGDVGASPITGAAIQLTDEQVNGTIYAVDAAGPAGSVIDPALLTEAKGDLKTAYNFAAGLTPTPSGPFLNPGLPGNPGNIGGMVLVPGLYKFTSTALITGSDVTLSGGPNDVWIFQCAQDLQLGSGIKVILAGGAHPRNIFWQVGTSAVLGTFSVFKGTILADQSITMNTSSTMDGRALAFEGGVTYNGTSGNLPEDPYADYGDAPDDSTHRFPTEDTTLNSRAGSRGVHHFHVGKEYFGTTVTAEAGLHDLNDPDGVPNVGNNDSDDGLVGISFVPIGDNGVSFSGNPSETHLMHATVEVSLAADAVAGPRYVNVLLDTNRDQEWRNTREGQEWVVLNYPVNIMPGTSDTILLALTNTATNPPPRDADMWMRMTLTDQPTSKTVFSGLGGWDGSGAMIHGETEDYLLYSAAAPDSCLVPPPPARFCAGEFKVRFNAPTLLLNQDQSGTVDMVVTVNGVGSSAMVEAFTVEGAAAPLVGDGISNVVLPGETGAITPALNTPLGPGTHHIQVPVGPFGITNSGITQSFAVCFTVSGFDCNGIKTFGATKAAGVVVIHPLPGVQVRSASLQFGPGAPHIPGQPIALQPASGAPIGYIRFGAQQATSGTITAMQVGDYPPGLPVEMRNNMLRLTSFFDIFSEVSPLSVTYEEQTQITGLDLAGYTAGDLTSAGILDETQLIATRYPTMADTFFNVYDERSTNVGGSYTVDTAQHRLNIQDPIGFSYYSLGLPEPKDTTVFRDDTFDTAGGWSQFGATRSDPTISQLDHDPVEGAYRVHTYAHPSRFRMAGWISDRLYWLPYTSIGTNNYVRTKFYMYTQGMPTLTASQYPNFKMRVANRYAVTAQLHIMTHDSSDPGNLANQQELRPSTDPDNPSVYRVDFDPIDVPFLQTNTTDEGILRAFESFTVEPTDNNILGMTESVMGVYPASLLVDSASQQTKIYAATGVDAGNLKIYNSGIDFRRWNYGPVPPGSPIGTAAPREFSGNLTQYTEGSFGITVNSSSVAPDRIGFLERQFFAGNENGTPGNEDRIRIAENKVYKVRWHVTSNRLTTQQSWYDLRTRAVKFGWNQTLGLGGHFGTGGIANQTLVRESTAGVGNQNPDKLTPAENGGWFTSIMHSPLNKDIRPEFPANATIEQRMPNIAAMPATGSALRSDRDVKLSLQTYDSLSLGAGKNQEAVDITIDRIEVRQYDMPTD